MANSCLSCEVGNWNLICKRHRDWWRHRKAQVSVLQSVLGVNISLWPHYKLIQDCICEPRAKCHLFLFWVFLRRAVVFTTSGQKKKMVSSSMVRSNA